jgi:hypothetical protein
MFSCDYNGGADVPEEEREELEVFEATHLLFTEARPAAAARAAPAVTRETPERGAA